MTAGRAFVALITGLLLACPSLVAAQPAAPAATTAAEPRGQPDAPRSALVVRAQQIEALIAGKLSPDVDARALFSASLRTSDIAVTRAVVALTSDAALFGRASRDPAVLEPLADEQARLAVAEAQFLRLPRSRRDALLARHDAAVAQRRKEADEASSRDAETARLQAQVGALEAFLAGKAAPAGTLSLDLLRDLPGLATPPQSAAEPSAKTAAKEPEPADLKRRLAQLRQQVLALPDDRLAALQSASGINLAPGAALALAEDQQRKAEAEAASAVNERDRLVAGERSKLLATKAAQARFEATLQVLGKRRTAIADNALGWHLQVRQIDGASGNHSVQADALYLQVVAALQTIRSDLRNSLASDLHADSADLMPAPLDAAFTSGIASAPELVRMRSQLASRATVLFAREEALRVEQQEALRDAMVMVNQARLDLIPYLSPAKQAAVLGFGQEGIAQVNRELAQISLDARFQVVNWRQGLSAAVAPFRQPTPSFVFALLGIMLFVLIFRWWRHKGDGILTSSEAALRRKRPRSLLNEAQANAFAYIQRVRTPLDWFVFVLVLRWLLPSEIRIVGLQFIWTIVVFSLAALLGARLADELARGRNVEDPRAELRWRSLRLVIGVLFAVVLVLVLTRESVGKGAIYNWVLSFCWLLAVPVVLLLVHWWRARIVTLSQAGSEHGALLAWAARDQGGIAGEIGRIAAGAVLLIQGAGSILARRARDFALVRELVEQRSRTVAARQVAEDKASGIYHRPSPEALAPLDPHRAPEQVRTDFGPRGAITLADVKLGNIVVIVGDRGLGKSAVLRDIAVAREADGGDCILIRIDHRGFAGALADACAAIGMIADAPDVEALVAVLAGRQTPATIIIDDLQRLIIPAIGGLADLDRLIALARRTGDSTAWVMAMGAPAWSYVSRARFDRVLFDKVFQLPHWPSDDLRALIMRRTAQAGFEPDFNDLVDVGSYQFDGDMNPAQRKRLAYFERLTDYAGGNPAIALEFWRRSLFIDSTTGKIVVRTFATPAVAELGALPSAAMFVLRAILQMDMAQQVAIERSTDLPPVIVADAVRSLIRLGVIAPQETCFRINLFWWSEVVRTLQRQNLIVRA
ncbi:MAG: hypothetical protein KKA12_03525 [Alphaproteobacteria bacterium]|nr:hypothetical protein [Alphaproteobacteria bacterium]